MRRRERAYFLVLGTTSTLALIAGAWPVPLVAFALLELSLTASEVLAALHARRAERTPVALHGFRNDAPGGILPSTP